MNMKRIMKLIHKITMKMKNLSGNVKVGIIYPLIVLAIGGIVKLSGAFIDSKIPKVDMVAEMLTPVPQHDSYDENINDEDEVKPESDSAELEFESDFDMYGAGLVNGELIPLYSEANDLEYAPTVRLSVTNRNGFTTNIKGIDVEVLEYKSPDEFTVEQPRGGADERPVQQWKCDISTAKKKYQAVYIGSTNVDTDDNGDKNYVCIGAGDAGEFNVVICPDTAGLYCIKVNVEYTFRGKVKTKTTDKMKFIISDAGDN